MTPDELAIEEIKQGNRDRFAELIERHQRMVYAIAWSYLGDADLCEDAAQEAFIKAFKYLRALRNPERFGGWLARIARNVSATFLRKRRKELAARQRWQAEQPEPNSTTDAGGESDALLQEMHRTLAELSPRHRECLVLFYLEGKSLREAAAVLGISEATMKMRLHRARHALRGRMEAQLEQSLENLAPRRNFAAGVMAVLPQSPLGLAGWGSGLSLLAKLGGVLGKLFSLLGFMAWMAAWQMASVYLMMKWLMHLEEDRLLDKPENAFRKKLLHINGVIVFIAIGAIWITSYWLIVSSRINVLIFYRVMAVLGLWGVFGAVRTLRVNRSAFAWGQFINVLSLTLATTLIGFAGAPLFLFFVVILLMNVTLMSTRRTMPRRQDYNLFLRQAQGLLDTPAGAGVLEGPIAATELRGFARFLGSQWFVIGYSIQGASIVLYLSPMRLRTSMFFGILRNLSKVTIDALGNVRAVPSPHDHTTLQNLLNLRLDAPVLESSVASALQEALALFARGEGEAAKRLLSPQADEVIFKSEPSRAQRVTQAVVILVLIATITIVYFLVHMPLRL